MGNDGGSIPDRRDLVKSATRAPNLHLDPLAQIRNLFLFCALSKEPLREPVVADPLGKIYNKESVIEWLLERASGGSGSGGGRYGDGERICGYVRGVKDLLTLKTTPNPSYVPPTTTSTPISPDSSTTHFPFICPLTLKEMNGSHSFVAMRGCGCVFSETGIRAVVAVGLQQSAHMNEGGKTEIPCPNCNKPIILETSTPSSSPSSSPPTSSTDPGNNVKLAGGSGLRLNAIGSYTISSSPGVNNTWIPLNPKQETQDLLLQKLLDERVAKKKAKAGVKAGGREKGPGKEGGRKDEGEVDGEGSGKKRKNLDPSLNVLDAGSDIKRSKNASSSLLHPSSTTGHHSQVSSRVQKELADLEAKRKASGMSESLKSIYGGRAGGGDAGGRGAEKESGEKLNGVDQFFGIRVNKYN